MALFRSKLLAAMRQGVAHGTLWESAGGWRCFWEKCR
jgi:hypothetical protein